MIKFNIISDEENYYFFRALNMSDNRDIEEKITVEVIVDKIKEKISDMDMSGLFELLVIKHIKENENDYITA